MKAKWSSNPIFSGKEKILEKHAVISVQLHSYHDGSRREIRMCERIKPAMYLRQQKRHFQREAMWPSVCICFVLSVFLEHCAL